MGIKRDKMVTTKLEYNNKKRNNKKLQNKGIKERKDLLEVITYKEND